MTEPDRNGQLLEIYKLHAELADRVSRRREGANRGFVSLMIALLTFIGIMIRFGDGRITESILLIVGGILVVGLAVAWNSVITSYRQLNSGKFEVLHQLEEMLPFRFFKKEWAFLEQGENRARYRKLTVVEQGLPAFFGVLGVVAIILGIVQFVLSPT